MSYNYRFLNAEMPEKEEVIEKTPNPATKKLLSRLDDMGVETYLDRFASQQPQCRFGLTGVCCQRCLWGPCRIDKKKPRGICGADANLIISGNLLRYLAAGCTAHGTHALQIAETILALAEDGAGSSIGGEDRLRDFAQRFGFDANDQSFMLEKAARILIGSIKGDDDKSIQKIIEKYAPEDRVKVWKELDILPRSAMEEVFESLHITTLGSCSDWSQIIKQDLKTALAYCYGSLFPACIGQEILYGIPKQAKAPVKVNYGVLGEKSTNILISGHSPVLAETLVAVSRDPEIKAAAKKAGAEKIVLAGSCCTGNALLSRHGIPTVANILALEMVAATGAVDALVLDMQCAIPGLKTVMECFGGRIITTCAGNRFPDDNHIPFPEPYNLEEAEKQAKKICLLAIENFRARRDKSVVIPDELSDAVYGWEVDSFFQACGGVEALIEAMKNGEIKGFVSIGGCNSPKVPYEHNHVKIARELIKNGILIFTSGCAAYALLNKGLASMSAAEFASTGLRDFCQKHGIPPVLPIGACTDNYRVLRIYQKIAEAAGKKMADMPFCHSGPAPGSEKNVGQGLSFLLHGISVHQGFSGGIPVPLPKQVESPDYIDDYEMEINDVARFFIEGIEDKLGSRVYVEPYPNMAAKVMEMHLHRKRMNLGWRG